MLIRPSWCGNDLILQIRDGCLAYATNRWPSRIDVDDFLRAMCGSPVNGNWYVYHEPDHRWLFGAMEMVVEIGKEPINISCLAMQNIAKVDDDESVSVIAAASAALMCFRRAYACDVDEARKIVQLNMQC